MFVLMMTMLNIRSFWKIRALIFVGHTISKLLYIEIKSSVLDTHFLQQVSDVFMSSECKLFVLFPRFNPAGGGGGAAPGTATRAADAGAAAAGEGAFALGIST